MFEGTTSLNVDAKGRLAVPSKFRSSLEGEDALVLTAHPHRCLLLYPTENWAPVAAQLSGLSSFNTSTAAVKRVMLGNASPMTLDSAGRLLLPPALRLYAHFEKLVYLVGMGSHFEIWSEAGWAEQNNLAASVFDATELPQALSELAL